MDSLDQYLGKPVCPHCKSAVVKQPSGFWKCPQCYQVLTDHQIRVWEYEAVKKPSGEEKSYSSKAVSSAERGMEAPPSPHKPSEKP